MSESGVFERIQHFLRYSSKIDFQMNVLSTVLTPEQKVQVKTALEPSPSDNQGDQDKEPTSVNGIDPVSGIVATKTFFVFVSLHFLR